MDTQRARAAWDLSEAFGLESSPERSPFLRSVSYEAEGHPAGSSAMALNLSSGGILLLMTHPVRPEESVTVELPKAMESGIRSVRAVVRWTRHFSLTPSITLYFVGLQFTRPSRRIEKAFLDLDDTASRSVSQ